MPVQVHREPLCTRYYAPVCSCAFLYFLASLVALLLIPFYLAYDGRTFWLESATYREQPEVAYSHQAVFLLEGVDAATAAPFVSYFSTVAAANALQAGGARPALVRSRASDANGDGRADAFVLSATLPLAPGQRAHALRALVFFATALNDAARLQMDTLAYWSGGGALPGGAFVADGDYVLRQAGPLAVRGGYASPYADAPLFDAAALTSAADAQFAGVLAAYAARNVTMQVVNSYTLWQGGGGASGAAAAGAGGAGAFNVTLTLRVNQQDVVVSPTPGTMLKVGWVQYAAMLVVVWLALDRLGAYVYASQLVETRVYAADAASAGGGRKLHYH